MFERYCENNQVLTGRVGLPWLFKSSTVKICDNIYIL